MSRIVVAAIGCTILLTSIANAGQRAGQPVAPSGAAIIGRVTDPSGRPVADVFVSALRPSLPDRPFIPVSARLGAITNAAGEFRLDIVRPEPLYVVALPHNQIQTGAGQLNRSGFAKTFFPNATDINSAQTVSVSITEPTRADIVLAPAPLSVIVGTVIGTSGQPVSGGTLGVTHGDGLFGLDSRAVQIRTDGRFIAPALSPGTYFLQFHESQWPPPAGTIPNVSGAKVVVTGSDTEVRVVPIRMVAVSGRVIVEPGVTSLGPTPIQIAGIAVEFDGNPGPVQPGVIGPDFTFSFKNWPGPVRLRLNPQQPWSIKSIRLRGADITDQPLELIEGRDIAGLEIELSKR